MSEDAARRLERILRSVLKVEPGTEATSLSAESHGEWDSIAHLNLILAVEQEFRIMLTPEEAAEACSFEAMLRLVTRRR